MILTIRRLCYIPFSMYLQIVRILNWLVTYFISTSSVIVCITLVSLGLIVSRISTLLTILT